MPEHSDSDGLRKERHCGEQAFCGTASDEVNDRLGERRVDVLVARSGLGALGSMRISVVCVATPVSYALAQKSYA